MKVSNGVTEEYLSLKTEKRMPAQKPGRSKQDYGTPKSFLNAVEQRFGPIAFDLAASSKNAVCDNWIGEKSNSFEIDWHEIENGKRRLLWLNPPFANISAWAKKCHEEASQGARIAMLVPAGVGTNWYAEHVHGKAMVFAVRPRLTFVGCSDPYPKDLILCLYDSGVNGFDCWKWTGDTKRPGERALVD